MPPVPAAQAPLTEAQTQQRQGPREPQRGMNPVLQPLEAGTEAARMRRRDPFQSETAGVYVVVLTDLSQNPAWA
jgi:hypothetical protein